MAAGVYSFLDVQAVIAGPGGIISLSNGAGTAGEGITIEPLTDRDILTIGADGSSMHSLVANKAARILVRMLKTAPANLPLMALFNLQTVSSNLHGQNIITITDFSRGDVVVCQKTAFAKVPPLNFAIEGGVNEWLFYSGEVDSGLGR